MQYMYNVANEHYCRNDMNECGILLKVFSDTFNKDYFKVVNTFYVAIKTAWSELYCTNVLNASIHIH